MKNYVIDYANAKLEEYEKYLQVEKHTQTCRVLNHYKNGRITNDEAMKCIVDIAFE